MLNEIIKVDLHIHSSASGYKDGSIVESSNKDNIDVLLKKIEEFDIKLFAITDHNRFDYDLYSSIKGKLDILNRNNLPGVEFDVILEENKPKCHIVAIFNDKDEEKVKCIQDNIFSIRKLNSPDDNYTLEEFEKILRKINLDVILIVHQRQGLDNDNGDTDSLSNATDNPSKFIKVGFIDCLEYNFPRVEGIVKNSLREMGVDFPLITGSDCHDWNFYPYRGKGCTKERVFTSLKCLPSFKGLLMSITSFKTRVNRNTNNNLHFISEISINGINYPLSNGINAIIGDNGSGKTLLANLLGSGSAKYYASLIRENSISYRTNDSTFQKDYVNYISQGSIVEKVRNGNLFDDRTYFDDISSKELFSNKIKLYFEDILSYVRFNIIK